MYRVDEEIFLFHVDVVGSVVITEAVLVTVVVIVCAVSFFNPVKTG